MKTDEQILRELARAAEGLLYLSESDHPFGVVHWEGLAEITPDHLRSLAGQAADAPVEVRGVDEFFRRAIVETRGGGGAEIGPAGGYQALVRVLKEDLAGTKVYRVGRINIPVFIVGRSPEGNWLGLSTRAVET